MYEEMREEEKQLAHRIVSDRERLEADVHKLESRVRSAAWLSACTLAFGCGALIALSIGWRRLGGRP